MKTNAFIFDIDGTLSDTARRRHHVEKTPKDWDAFFADQINDDVLPAADDAKLLQWNYSIDGVRPQTNNPIIIIQRNVNGKPYPFPVWDKEGV
jgi:hypothetical protein